jgi:hypothetical protein
MIISAPQQELRIMELITSHENFCFPSPTPQQWRRDSAVGIAIGHGLDD